MTFCSLAVKGFLSTFYRRDERVVEVEQAVEHPMLGIPDVEGIGEAVHSHELLVSTHGR